MRTHGDFAYNTEPYALHVLHIRERRRALGAQAVLRLRDRHEPDVPVRGRRLGRAVSRTLTATKLLDIVRLPSHVVGACRPRSTTCCDRRGTAAADLSRLRMCCRPARRCRRELYDGFKARFGVEILDGIGSAEMFHIFISNTSARSAGHPRSPRARLRSADRRPRKPRGSNRRNGHAAHQRRFSGIVLLECARNIKSDFRRRLVHDRRSVFRVDERGYYWYCGRTDDAAGRSGGIFVSPTEMENCLVENDAVVECAVIGAPDEQKLIKPKAFVVLNAGFKASAELEQELKRGT